MCQQVCKDKKQKQFIDEFSAEDLLLKSRNGLVVLGNASSALTAEMPDQSKATLL